MAKANASTCGIMGKKKDDLTERQMRRVLTDKENEIQVRRMRGMQRDEKPMEVEVKMLRRPSWPACACCH